MIRSTLATLALLLAIPAHAGSFYPNLFGRKYCQLRSVGVEHKEAIKVAMAENWSKTRKPLMVTINGEQISSDAITAAIYIKNNCPELSQ